MRLSTRSRIRSAALVTALLLPLAACAGSPSDSSDAASAAVATTSTADPSSSPSIAPADDTTADPSTSTSADPVGEDAVDIRPDGLERGPLPTVPYSFDDVLHDGPRTTTLPGYTTVLGTTGNAVIAYVATRTDDRVYAVGDGDRVLLTRLRSGQGAVLSDDGRVLHLRDKAPQGASRIRVLSTTDGDELASRTVRGVRTPIGGTGDTVYLEGNRVTLRWNWGEGDGAPVEQVVSEEGVLVSVGADLLTTASNPAGNPCTSVRRLSEPDTVLWRSCDERVFSISPDGRRMITRAKSGENGDVYRMRTVDGDLLGVYRGVGRTFFDELIAWEDDRTAVFAAHGPTEDAYVRCTADSCEQAGRSVVRPTAG